MKLIIYWSFGLCVGEKLIENGKTDTARVIERERNEFMSVQKVQLQGRPGKTKLVIPSMIS